MTKHSTLMAFVAASFLATGVAYAGVQFKPFDFASGDVGPVLLPGPKICPKDGDPGLAACTLPYIAACNEAGGTAEAVSTNNGPNVMSCKK